MCFLPIIQLAFILSGGLIPFSAEGSPPLHQDPAIVRGLARIDSLLAVESWQPALAEARGLQTAHGDNPYHGWAIESRLGVVLLLSGDPLAALAPLENAIRLAPTRAENHRNLGAALVKLGRRGRALSEYAQAVELAPRDFELRLEYGQLLLDFGDHDRSRDQLLTAAHLCGDCAQTRRPLARLYLAAGEFSSAVPILEDLYASQANAPGIRRSLIQALQGAGSDTFLLEFLGQDPVQDLPADEALLLVELEGKLKRPQFSERFAREAGGIEAGPSLVPGSVAESPAFWGRVSYNLLEEGINRSALAAVNRAIDLDPTNIVFLNNRVVLLIRLDRPDEAAREWEKVLAIDPSLKERSKR